MNKLLDFAIPDWLKRLALYVALAAALLGTGYIKGCTDERVHYTQFKAEVVAAGKAQEQRARAQAALDKADKERRDAKYKRSLAGLERELDRVRRSARSGVLPAPSPQARDTSTITFDRAELDRALRDFTGEAAELVGEGAAAQAGLDSLR